MSANRGASWERIAAEYKSERDALRADVNRAREMQATAEAELAALQAKVEALREALRKLTNEVAGVLSLAEPELRAAAGNTNVALLRQRVDEAAAEAREAQRLRPDAAIGAVVWQFIDRMNDVAPESGDSAERILFEFTAAVRPHIRAALGAKL